MSGSSPNVPASPRRIPSLRAVRAEQCRRSLAQFVRQSWHVLEPTASLEWNWHIDAIAMHVQAQLEEWAAAPERSVLQNLAINVPPGTGKSRLTSVCASAWAWLRWPSLRIGCLSSNPRVAVRDSIYARDLITSDWYQQTFRPDWTLNRDRNGKELFANTAGGFRSALGFSSRITGDRWDWLMVDDPHDAQEVHSDQMRSVAIDRWNGAIGNRLNDLRRSRRTLIMQRLHEADLCGVVLAQGGWAHLCLPMEFEPHRIGAARDGIPLETPIGWRDPRTEPGELLFPKRFPREILDAERERLGSLGYAGQMQQRPTPADGDIFRSAWFAHRYTELPALDEVYVVWDTALKAAESNDESAGLAFGIGEDGLLYLLDLVHGRWETPDVAQRLVAQYGAMRMRFGSRARGCLVEDKGSGTTLVQYLRRAQPGIPIIPVPAETDKAARARGVTPLLEAGRLRLPCSEAFPESRAWVTALVEQCLAFPAAKHDDRVDVLVYALRRLMNTLRTPQQSKRIRRGGYV